MRLRTLQRHPAIDVLGRCQAVLRAAWQRRFELAGPKRLADELAFLPAALSLQETPPHPAPRRLAVALCALFAVALAWAWWGRVDIVATAQGRIVVSERSKTLQPLETSVVTRVRVKDGDAVVAGQVLVELDATNARADGASVQEQLAVAVSQEWRAAALLAAWQEGRPPALPRSQASAVAGSLTETERAAANALLEAEWHDTTARLARLAAECARREAELATVRELVAKLDATLPMARQREADYRNLVDQGFLSSHAGQDRQRERVEQERDLAMQRARLAEARAALHESEQARAAYRAETHRTLGERQAEAASRRRQFAQELRKADQRSRLTELVAPVAGTVQQVAVHTEGGVVTPAQVLMVIVPRDAEVTAEVVVDNKDIGFVTAGQDAVVKLETFPFTRYGTVPATVKHVAADAVADDRRGAIFPAVLTLRQTHLDVDGKRIALAPGMNLSAEVRTGSRRVIDYLLDPVQRTASESLRER